MVQTILCDLKTIYCVRKKCINRYQRTRFFDFFLLAAVGMKHVPKTGFITRIID